ncbi:unnamed protein product [Caenorhabditis angaria]|uniref:Uncharacterized protein n=1 Tax=Caenorhabditis angaria TaxID=860376 RepID=A0A9P1MWK0_9PELO|nr:unnamed protein product [Caenorhabditis angaria]
MTFMLAIFWLQWFEAFIAKCIILPYQYGLLTVGDPTKAYTSWWTDLESDMIPINYSDNIIPLLVASHLLWHYIYSIMFGVVATGTERIFATFYIHDYERKSRRYIPISLFIITHIITVPFAYCMTYNIFPYYIGFGTIIFLMALSLTVFLLVWKINFKLKNEMEKNLASRIFTLGEKFQIKENYRALLMAKRILIFAVCYAPITSTCFTLVNFKIIGNNAAIFIHLMENSISFNPLFTCPVLISCSSVWVNQFYKCCPILHNILKKKNNAVKEKINETDIYFNQLKNAWI